MGKRKVINKKKVKEKELDFFLIIMAGLVFIIGEIIMIIMILNIETSVSNKVLNILANLSIMYFFACVAYYRMVVKVK